MSFIKTNYFAFATLAAFAVPATAFWRLPCNAPLIHERIDPIVSPGRVGSHLHTVMGGNGLGFTESYADTQESTCSSCLVTKDFSNYWVPELLYQAENGSFINVNQVGGATVYYLQRSDPQDPEYENGLLAFPEGFRMVAGNPMLRNYTDTLEQQAISFNCLGTSNPETPMMPNYNCPGGLRSQVFFPSCWNGRDLDSPDHKSHMSYPSIYNAGHCPPDYPKRFISLFYEVVWDTNAFADMWYGDSHPFVFSMGDPTGCGYHDQCTDDSGVIQDCPVFDFFSDTETNGCKVPSQVDEQVSGWMDTLPGCNPVQPGPAMATAASGCDAPTTIGLPENPFVDLTVSNGFEYIGCGQDSISSRTLTGPNQATDDMTNKKCVEFCSSQGYTVAGTEYTNQCYCGNSVPAAQAPIPGLMGDCFMPCSGDSTENCGGAGTISLYQKCGATCQNIVYTVNNSTAGTSGSTGNTGSGSSPAGPSSSAPSAFPTMPYPSGGYNASSTRVAASSAAGATQSAPGPSSQRGSSAGSSPVSSSANKSPVGGALAGEAPVGDSSPSVQPVTVSQIKTVIPLPASTPAPAGDAGANNAESCGAVYTVTVPAMTVTITETLMITTHVQETKTQGRVLAAPTPNTAVAASNPPPAPPSPPASSAVISSAPYGMGNTTSTARGHQHIHASSLIHSHDLVAVQPTGSV